MDEPSTVDEFSCVEQFFLVVTKKGVADKIQALKINSGKINDNTVPTIDNQIIVDDNGSGVICSDVRAQNVLKNAVMGSFGLQKFVRFGVANVIPLLLYASEGQNDFGYFYESLCSRANPKTNDSGLKEMNRDRTSETQKSYIGNYEKNISKNGGITELVKDGFRIFGNVILTTDLVRKYNINICQLLMSGISIWDLKNSGLISTFNYLVKNLDFRPSDLLVNKSLLSLSHLRQLYNITFRDLTAYFCLTPEDYLIDYHFSVGEFITMDLDILTIFPSLNLLESQCNTIKGAWLMIKDSMNLFYRWYLTVNCLKLNHIYKFLPKINKQKQFDLGKLPQNISEFLVNNDEDDEKFDAVSYVNRNFQVNIGATLESNNDSYNTWESIFSMKASYMTFLFPNADDLLKVRIMACDMSPKNQNMIKIIGDIYNDAVKDRVLAKNVDTDKKFLSSRLFSNFMIVVSVEIIGASLEQYLNVKNNQNSNKNNDIRGTIKDLQQMIKSFKKHIKKLESKSGIRLLRTQELESKSKCFFDMKCKPTDVDKVDIKTVDNMIENDLVACYQIPLDTTNILNYRYFNMICGNILDYDKMRSCDSIPSKQLSSKRIGLTESSFDDEKKTKMLYKKAKQDRMNMKLCKKYHNEKTLCYSEHVYLMDSISLSMLLEYIKSTETKLNKDISKKLNAVSSTSDQISDIHFFDFTILGVVPVKNFVYGTKKYWASRAKTKGQVDQELSSSNIKRRKNKTSRNQDSTEDE